MIKTADAAVKVQQLTDSIGRIVNRKNRDTIKPRNQSKPNTDTLPVNFAWWQKES